MSSQIQALEAARSAFVHHEAKSADSIRRMAHALRGSGATYGFPEITESAGKVEDAPDDRVAACLERLLVTLREVVAGGDVPKTNVLVVDDDPAIGRLLKQELTSEARRILVAYSGSSAQEILTRTPVSLIILDIVLPDMDGRNLLLKLREQTEMASVPIIVLSALRNRQSRTECLALGADEYVDKPFQIDLLASLVSARLQRAGASLQESGRDPLTGLLNRASLRVAFGLAQARAQRAKEPVSIGIIDMDHFKSINDTYGHAAGDEALRSAAGVISKSLRQADIFARVGGEEFVAVFADADRQGARAALEKALGEVRDLVLQAGDGRSFQVRFSAGVADVRPGAELEEALESADRLLYKAKAAGRNRVTAVDDEVAVATRKILIADDDPLVTTVVTQRLGNDGFEVIHYPDGEAALAGSDDPSVELFLLDVQMPNMDGFQLLERLRKKPSLAKKPVMMLTSLGNEADVVRGLELGADDYVTKPFSPVELAARVRRLLKQRG